MHDITRHRAQALALARQVLRHRPSGGGDRDEPARLGESLAALEADPDSGFASSRRAFIPRDPRMALLQADFDRASASPGDGPVGRSGPPTSFLGRALDWFLSLLPASLYDRFAEGFHPGQGIDPEWVKAYYELLFRYGRERRDFTLPPGRPVTHRLADDARVILVSDWGTGEDFAKRVAEQIGKAIREAPGRETHVVHLGDVYYAGTQWEAENRFLAHWPVPPGGAGTTSSWCLNGNHDMYAAGTGLFGTILTDPRFARQRTVDGDVSSELHLRGEHWQILGLDTAWQYDPDDIGGREGHLGAAQRRWLDESVPHGAGPRTILLGHHPALVNDGGTFRPEDYVRETAGALRADGRRVDAWFWGHKHQLITYDTPRELGVDYAACMGHGAIPARPDAADDHPPPREHRFTGTISDGEDVYYRCGFTVLDLDGERITVSYVDLDGRPWAEGATVLPVTARD